MSYSNEDFWTQYAAYVEECLPRHAAAAKSILRGRRLTAFIDLGCGRNWTADRMARLISKRRFVSLRIDSDPNSNAELVGDYRKAKDYDKLIDIARNGRKAGPPTEFVSLFSSECTGSWAQNFALYSALFEGLPSLEWGLVTGFYYRGREEAVTVAEAGGIVSYQSVTPLGQSPIYTETRLTFEAPSKMFGPDVIEVWKLLERR